jgi:hypothetical protein
MMLEFLDGSLTEAELKTFKKVVSLHFKQGDEQPAEALKRTVAWIEEEARLLQGGPVDVD